MNRLPLIAVFVALAAQSVRSGTAQSSIPLAQTQVVPPAPCTLDGALPGEAATNYLNAPEQELKKQVPGLRSLRFEPGQDQISSILDKASKVLGELFRRIPNLVAREEVRRPLPPGIPSSLPLDRRGGNLDATQDDSTVTRYSSRDFVYRIVPGRGADGTEILNEFRTDNKDHVVDGSGRDPESPRNIGFATSWLFFFRANQEESSFRYLGEQKIGKRETFVVAFAQNPGHNRLSTVLESYEGPCSAPSQGVAWIDQSTYRILRMQTDLLAPVPSIHLTMLRTVLDYREVRIPERGLVLWLPDMVKNSWQTAGVSGEELHLYTHYRLFGSTVRVLPDSDALPPSASKPTPNPPTP